MYCDGKDSIDHASTGHAVVKKKKKKSQEVIIWFIATNRNHFNARIEEKLFGVTSEPYGRKK